MKIKNKTNNKKITPSSKSAKAVDNQAELLHKSALEALKFSYAPYSKFNVASAVMTANGKIYSGCNIENASYGGTICAERVAINKAVSEGHLKFKAILVMTKMQHPVSPCGLCGQTMLEFFEPNTKIYLANSHTVMKELTLKELLPYGFTRQQML